MTEQITAEQKRRFLADFDDVYNAAHVTNACPAYVGSQLVLFVHRWKSHETLHAIANSVLEVACAAPDFSKIRFLIGMYRIGFRIDFGDEVL